MAAFTARQASRALRQAVRAVGIRSSWEWIPTANGGAIVTAYARGYEPREEMFTKADIENRPNEGANQ